MDQGVAYSCEKAAIAVFGNRVLEVVEVDLHRPRDDVRLLVPARIGMLYFAKEAPYPRISKICNPILYDNEFPIDDRDPSLMALNSDRVV